MLEQGLHVKPALAEDPAPDIRRGDNYCPSLGEKSGRKRAEISKTLPGHASARQGHAQVFKQGPRHVKYPSPRGRFAPLGAAQFDGLPRHTRRRVSVLRAVLVEDPGHHLGIGIDIRRGDVAVRDRKSTRLNSSHGYISYAVFCLKKKKKEKSK